MRPKRLVEWIKIMAQMVVTLFIHFSPIGAYTASETYSVTTSPVMEFAKQAGTIAGTVKACGQNLTIFNQRVEAAINHLSNVPTERALAHRLFQKTMQEVFDIQQTCHPIVCQEALTAFNQLPLNQDNYQSQVLQVLQSMSDQNLP